VHRRFRLDRHVLSCTAAPVPGGAGAGAGDGAVARSNGLYRPLNTVERIEFAGQDKAPARVVLRSAGQQVQVQPPRHSRRL